MNPPTLHVKTCLLALHDLVVHEGDFWEVRKLNDAEGVGVVTLGFEGKDDVEIIDYACPSFSPTSMEKSHKQIFWRVVNLG